MNIKLEEIKRLKSENYVGTMEAKEYLDRFAEINTRPSELASIVSSFTGKDVGKENIFNLCSKLEYIVDPLNTGYDSPRDNVRNDMIYDVYGENVSIEWPVEEQVFASFVDTPWSKCVFIYDQMENPHFTFSDENFKDKLIGWYTKDDPFKAAVDDIIGSLDEMDYRGEIANEIRAAAEDSKCNNFNDYKKKMITDAKALFLNEKNMLDRVVRDQYEHRIEYRKQIMHAFLRSNGIKSYGEAYELTRYNVESAEKRFEDAREKGGILMHTLPICRDDIISAKKIHTLISKERNYLKRVFG